MNKYTSHIDPSQEEAILRKYISGEANGNEAHWLENRALSDPFLAEAIEGFESNPASANKVDRLRKRIDQQTRTSNGSWWLVPGIIMVTTILIWVMLGSEPNALTETKQVAQKNTTEKSIQAEEPVVVERKMTDSSMTFTVKEAPKTSNVQTPVIEELKEEYMRKTPAPEPIQTDVPVSVDSPSQSADEREPMLMGAPIYHVLDFKMVDYTGIRVTNSWKIQFTPDLGTPASIQSKDDKTVIILSDTKDVAYVDYLEETMELFALARYKKAMKRFNTILEHFPSDANGLFYGGICARELNRHETSITYLRSSAELMIVTFKAESEFYLAKELLEIKEDNEACELLEKIQNDQGFYAERAAEIAVLYCVD